MLWTHALPSYIPSGTKGNVCLAIVEICLLKLVDNCIKVCFLGKHTHISRHQATKLQECIEQGNIKHITGVSKWRVYGIIELHGVHAQTRSPWNSMAIMSMWNSVYQALFLLPLLCTWERGYILRLHPRTKKLRMRLSTTRLHNTRGNHHCCLYTQC